VRSKALVLGGGGVTGVAWELGVLQALAAAGLDLGDADLVVGTSAGSLVGALLAGGQDLDKLVTGQLATRGAAEETVDFDLERMAETLIGLMAGGPEPLELRRRIGAMALDTPGSEAERLEVIRTRLPVRDWPPHRLLVTAVDVETGEFVCWHRGSGVPLDLAVAASCAVPGVWPPVTVNGRRYMDGGMRTPTNVDLAEGNDVILVLAPIPGPGISSAGVEAEAAPLRERSEVLVIGPDAAAVEAIGPNPLDYSRREAAARAGQAQGAALAESVRELWAG
jgi:NTE family protein